MRLRRLLPFAIIGLFAVPPAGGQPAFLVRDINTDQGNVGALNGSPASEGAGNVFYFTLDDGTHGGEVWRSDGTEAGTFLLKDIAPGAMDSLPRSLTAFQGKLFFGAFDYNHGVQGIWKSDGTPEGTSPLIAPAQAGLLGGFMAEGERLFFAGQDAGHGAELWLTDGTAEGTHLVRDLSPGIRSSLPHFLAAGNGRVLFTADDGIHGFEPWISDGTEAGTRMLADLRPGEYGSLLTSYGTLSELNAAAAPWGFVFVANDGVHGSEPWITDGTPEGTALLKDVYPGTEGFSYGLTAIGGAVVFAAWDPATGFELWRTGGTPATTALLKDVWPGASSSRPLDLTAAGGRVFFRAADGVHGAELWATDGTAAGTVLVRDISPGAADAFPPPYGGFDGDYGLTRVGSRLFFFALQEGSPGLWQSDGTADGTQPVPDPGGGWPYPSSIDLIADGYGAAGSRLFFRSGSYGQEIWTADGAAGGSRLAKSVPLPTSSFLTYNGAPIHPGTLAGLGGALFFQATDGHSGAELWLSDGTPAGTSQMQDLTGDSYSSNPQQLHAGQGRLFFLANSNRLGVSDGTPAGTQQVPFDISVGEIATVGDQVFLLAQPGGSPNGLWKTDGTEAGTVLLKSYQALFPPATMTGAGGRLFYRGSDNPGLRLWVSDGTAPGTLDLDPGPGPSEPWNLTAAGATLFFTAYQPDSGRELWKTDGTRAGTVIVKDIQPGSGSSSSIGIDDRYAPLPGGVLLFTADDGTAGTELWRSDGTADGTVLVKDIHPGPQGSRMFELTAAGGKVYFTADDGDHGQELWVSDGTAGGTRMVKEIVPGPDSPLPRNLTAAGSVLVFTAFDPAHGQEIWRSDGTALGTRRLQDIAPGPGSSSPSRYTVVGSNLFFVANDNVTGFELWAMPTSALLATFEDVPATHWAWSSVEAVAAAGITQGCGEGLFCAERTLTRAEMGVFLGRGLHGSAFVPPPATGTRFTDVPASYWAADWIEQIATDGVTQGCAASPPRYCPAAQVSRAEMAIFLLRTRHGGAYVPPPATGTRFADVPAGFWAAAWIEQLAAEGITNGCDVNLYCPNKTVGRAEMAVFLTRAFNLPLP